MTLLLQTQNGHSFPRFLIPALACVLSFLALMNPAMQAEVPLDYTVELTSPTKLYTPERCWGQPRLGTIPPKVAGNASAVPVVVMTMSPVDRRGSDVFGQLHQMRTTDLGKTWEGPAPVPGYELRPVDAGGMINIADFQPSWHAHSGMLLATGATIIYDLDPKRGYQVKRDVTTHPDLLAWTAYASYDPKRGVWAPWKKLEMPAGRKFRLCSSGCVQRYDLPNGDILLPIRFVSESQSSAPKQYTTIVARCRFDGETLSYLEHGTELTVPIDRGLFEPSLTWFRGRFYLTMRNEHAGYVATSTDGLHYDMPRKWTFDDGSDLGNYNTQQHWVTHSNGLFLAYTRRGANNDHVFRHRAPLFIGRVNPEKLHVIRATERELMPNRGARLGNFSVTEVSPHQTWLSDCEWMHQHEEKNKQGADGSVWVTKIHWNQPNEYAK
jgi:hypothetical protein